MNQPLAGLVEGSRDTEKFGPHSTVKTQRLKFSLDVSANLPRSILVVDRRHAYTFAARAALLLGAGAAPCGAQEAAPSLAGYDAYVAQAMKDWRVPGAAIAIVRNDSVILIKGYGVRKLGDPAPVGPHTMFSIGSATKAFTGVLLGRLVDEGKVKWDDPVQSHLPGFEMYDRYVSRDLTVRDLLTHRSGLPPGDFLWYGNGELSREEIVRRIRYFKPAWPIRTRFGYNNLMFLAAGMIVEARRGISWDEAIKQELFAPLGMGESHTSNRDFAGIEDAAQPHLVHHDTVITIARRNIDNMGPAGSIISTASDMAKWVMFQLDSGRVGGRQILSTVSLAESHTPQIMIRREGPWAHVNPYTHFESYGFGWWLHDFRGREVVEHGGNIDGMSAMVGFMPEERAGVVILTNLNQTVFVDAMLWYTLDRLLTAAPRDWSAELLKVSNRLQAGLQGFEAARVAARIKDTRPSLPLEKYVGTYADSLFGDARVTIEDGHLVARYGTAFTGDLAHWHYDTFQATWRDPMLGAGLITFELGPNGSVARMSIPSLADFIRTERR